MQKTNSLLWLMRKEWKCTSKSPNSMLWPTLSTRAAIDTYSKTDGSAPSVATQRPCCRDDPLKYHPWANCTPSLSDWSQLWHRSICNTNNGFTLWTERPERFPGTLCFRIAVIVQIFPVILVDELIPIYRPFPGASNHVKVIVILRWQS